jgi:hypothetical protein
MNLNAEDREFIQILIQSNNAKAEYRYDLLDNKISEMDKRITDRLDKINGKVQKHDNQIEEALTERSGNRQKNSDEIKRLDEKIDNIGKIHILQCPNVERIKNLEKNEFGRAQILKFIIAGITISSVIILIILNLEKLIFGG